MYTDRPISSQSFTTPAMFIVNALLLPIRRKTLMLSAVGGCSRQQNGKVRHQGWRGSSPLDMVNTIRLNADLQNVNTLPLTESACSTAQQQWPVDLQPLVMGHLWQLQNSEGHQQEDKTSRCNVVQSCDWIQFDALLLQQYLDKHKSERLSRNGATLEYHTQHIEVQLSCECRQKPGFGCGCLLNELNKVCL